MDRKVLIYNWLPLVRPENIKTTEFYPPGCPPDVIGTGVSIVFKGRITAPGDNAAEAGLITCSKFNDGRWVAKKSEGVGSWSRKG